MHTYQQVTKDKGSFCICVLLLSFLIVSLSSLCFLQTVSQNLVDVDIIALEPSQNRPRFPHSLLRAAIEKDVYYEVGNMIS